MVDIHSHILPGLDDGSPSLDATQAMLRLAAETGTTDIVATPHASPDYKFDPDTVDAKLTEVRAAAPPGLSIHQGADFHLDFDLIEDALAHPRKYTINGGPYLLVELAERTPLRAVPQILDSLMRRGLIPILTHPERYYTLRGKTADIREWVAAGCLVQVTAQSMTGLFGSTARKMAEQLLDSGYVHFFASDAHDTEVRTTRLDAARNAVERRAGPKTAERLFDLNPRATLSGLPLPPPVEESRPKRWFFF